MIASKTLLFGLVVKGVVVDVDGALWGEAEEVVGGFGFGEGEAGLVWANLRSIKHCSVSQKYMILLICGNGNQPQQSRDWLEVGFVVGLVDEVWFEVMFYM